MNAITAATPLTAVDLTKLGVTKLSGPSPSQLLTESAPPASNTPADNDLSNLYATIQKDGKTIATFYKGGLMVTPDNLALPNDLAMAGHGLSLANQRIQQMLDMYGGKVEYAQDARTRSTSAMAATLFSAQVAGQ